MGRRTCGKKWDKNIGIGVLLAKRKGLTKEEYVELCTKYQKKVLLQLLIGW
jgi:hypothetical protein